MAEICSGVSADTFQKPTALATGGGVFLTNGLGKLGPLDVRKCLIKMVDFEGVEEFKIE